MAFDISFPFICRENSRRSGIPLFPNILRTQRFRLSRLSRMVGDKSGKLGLILSNNFPEAPQISAMISGHSSNYYVGHRRHSLADCQPSYKSISAYKSKSIIGWSSVFLVISGIIKGEVSIRQRLITLTEILIIPHIKINHSFIIHCFKKITTNTPSHRAHFDIALGNHALRAQTSD